jgi:hypothetical protein
MALYWPTGKLVDGGEQMAQRRNRICYRRRHQRKLSKRHSITHLPSIDLQSPVIPLRQPDENQLLITTGTVPPVTQGTVLSETSASKLDSIINPEVVHVRATVTPSKASTVVSGILTEDGKLNIPSPPRLDGRDVFECPYCCILCDAKCSEPSSF